MLIHSILGQKKKKKKPFELELLSSPCLPGGNQGAQRWNDWVRTTRAGLELEQACSRVWVTSLCALQSAEP